MTPGPGARARIALVLVACLALSVSLAFVFPLVDPDEGRNAEVAGEMAAGGDLVIPHLAGMPYLDKPPALFALGAFAVRAFGRTPFAVRLPAIVAAIVTLLLLARLARRAAADDAHAWRAVALTAVAPLFAVLAAYVIFDMPLAACVTAVWTAIALEVEQGPDPRTRLGLFLAIAIGILLKGPVMLAWAIGGSLAAAWLLRDRAALRWLAWWPGWIVALGIPAAWFAAALRRYPEYAHYAFIEESFERLTTRTFHRTQAWWFVPATLIGGALPWSLLTPWRAPAARVTRVAAGFVLFAAVFFALSRSQLVTYLLPAIPALAWWAGECWARARRPAWLLAASLAFTPVLLVTGGRELFRQAERASGAPLARALRQAGSPPVTYDRCYSPGTDFLLGRRSAVVSRTGAELTSNYVLRYGEVLKRRGEWTLVDTLPVSRDDAAAARVIVVARGGTRQPPAGTRIFEDRRFAAWLRPIH